MAKLGIFTGTTPNDGTGDSLLTGAVKINANFTEIYTAFGDGTNLGIASLTQINASGVITATTFNGNLRATGVSTFATGATVLVGTATSSGTSAQALQVGSASSVQGAYISGLVGIGTTISPYALSISSSATPTPGLSGALVDVTSSVNGYTQVNIRNTSTGNNASSDLILTADTGTDTTNFVDLGVNNSGFSAGTWTINGPTDAYLYTSDTNLAIGVAGVGKSLSFFTGGTLAANERMRVTSVGVGIGSTNPAYALSVQGDVQISGTLRNSSFVAFSVAFGM